MDGRTPQTISYLFVVVENLNICLDLVYVTVEQH